MGTNAEGNRESAGEADSAMDSDNEFWRLPEAVREGLLRSYPQGLQIGVPGPAQVGGLTIADVINRGRRPFPAPPVWDLSGTEAPDPKPRTLVDELLPLLWLEENPIRGLDKKARNRVICIAWDYLLQQGRTHREAEAALARLVGLSSTRQIRRIVKDRQKWT